VPRVWRLESPRYWGEPHNFEKMGARSAYFGAFSGPSDGHTIDNRYDCTTNVLWIRCCSAYNVTRGGLEDFREMRSWSPSSKCDVT